METKERLNFIYILKFISAIIIAIFLHWNDHFIAYLDYSNIYKNKIMLFLTTKTYILVELFFIISGLLFFITSNEKIKNNTIKFKDFLVKKIARLFPVIFFASIYMFIANLYLYIRTGYVWSGGTSSLFELFFSFIGGRIIVSGQTLLNGPIWYVSVLLLCFIVAFYLSKKSVKYGDKIFLIPILVSLIIFYNFTKTPLLNIYIVRGLSAFFIGIFVGKFLNLYNDFSIKSKVITKIVSFLFLVIWGVCFYFKAIDNFYTPDTFSYSLFVFIPLILFLYGFNILNKIFSLKIFKHLGDISYSIYIWNFPILITMHILYTFGIFKYNIYTYKFFILLLLIHLNISILSYLLIEKKCKNMKFNFINKLLD